MMGWDEPQGPDRDTILPGVGVIVGAKVTVNGTPIESLPEHIDQPRVVELGQSYRDRVSGLAGVATARIERYLGVTQVRLERRGTDGLIKEIWFNEGRLEAATVTEREEAYA